MYLFARRWITWEILLCCMSYTLNIPWNKSFTLKDCPVSHRKMGIPYRRVHNILKHLKKKVDKILFWRSNYDFLNIKFCFINHANFFSIFWIEHNDISVEYPQTLLLFTMTGLTVPSFITQTNKDHKEVLQTSKQNIDRYNCRTEIQKKSADI